MNEFEEKFKAIFPYTKIWEFYTTEMKILKILPRLRSLNVP